MKMTEGRSDVSVSWRWQKEREMWVFHEDDRR